MYSKRYKTSSDHSSGFETHEHDFLKIGAYTSSTARPKTPVLRESAHHDLPQTPIRERSISPRASSRRHKNYTTRYPHRTVAMMLLFPAAALLYIICFAGGSYGISRSSKQSESRQKYCPDYKAYSARPHPPYTEGKYAMPYQRPVEHCRLFKSQAVEDLIQKMINNMADPDLARLFENAYPNTLDTTVRWHVPGGPKEAQSFIVTGDINAQWLRDSTNQLSQYQRLAKTDPGIKTLILGAINTQADFILQSPYCNAFQPPLESGLAPTNNGQDDVVHPIYDPTVVFECKYEIDSLASFLDLANTYYENTKDTSFVTTKWLEALRIVLAVIEQQQTGTFSSDGSVIDSVYTFQRRTTLGTETLSLSGIGNPLAANTSLVRSSFRPSDDATVLQFFIPGNAFLSVQLKKTAKMLRYAGYRDLVAIVEKKGEEIETAINNYGIVDHPVWGKVYAYEVDGYGSHILMDDANLPSLLSLPLLGFVSRDDPVYQNTRRMVLSPSGNPYFLRGGAFSGIGGPHIGIRNAWPMSLLVQIMTSDDDEEITKLLKMVLKASNLGLIHESVDVDMVVQYTRSWFAWANSVYAETIFDLADRKPHLIFK
ncbi:hypothetical protein BDZ91DRAFT_731798 [Kalaharituber pfeilii]|nr:hypothetical protein BDZ91DRAFT_731798 [Kalaharituber pfeilii]